MAAAHFEIFNNTMFKESLEKLVKSLVKKTLSEGWSSTSTEVEDRLFSSFMKMPDVESVTSDSSYFLDEIVSDVSFNSLREDPAVTTRHQQDSFTNTEVKMSSTTLSGDSGSFSDDPETSVSTEEGAQDPGINKEMDPFIMRTLKGIQKVAPNLRYKPKNFRRKKFKVVPYEFASVWKNLPSLFSTSEATRRTTVELQPVVNWEKVNISALKKFPAPVKFPVHSVSPDPMFYLNDCACKVRRAGNLCTCPHYGAKQAPFLKHHPFGALSGFTTNLGVLPIPATPMFGHVWDEETSSWLLHASTPEPGERRGRPPTRRRTRGTPRGRTERRRWKRNCTASSVSRPQQYDCAD